MIQVITSQNHFIYGKQLDQMFRMRHEYYVLGHGWDGLTGVDGREVDEFDDLDAVYLVSVDEFGDVAASLRLNPTTGPTLLKKFSAYADAPLPASETCWDLSRWIARPDQRRADGKRWPSNHQRELALGVLEFCQSRGADCLTMLCEARLAERIKAYGWPVEYLGAPRAYEGGKGTAVAARIDVGDHVLAQTRAKTGIVSPVLYEVDAAALAMRPPATPAHDAEAVAGLVREIEPQRLRELVRLLTKSVVASTNRQTDNPDPAAALSLLAAFNRMLEVSGAGFDLAPLPAIGAPSAATEAQTDRRRASSSGN